MVDEHWSDDIETTPEVKAAMVNGKYDSLAEWRIGAANAMKSVGAPFKLPKSLDKLPSDEVRADFQKQVDALRPVYDEKQLDDVNYAEGLADAKSVNEDLKKAFAGFLKENEVPKAMAQKLIAFNNGQATLFSTAAAKKSEGDAAIVKGTIDGLYGGEEGVAKHHELVTRMFDKHGGLTTEENEALTEILKSGTSRHAVLTRALFNLAKEVVVEGKTELTGTGSEKKKETLKERQKRTMPGISSFLWPEPKAS